MMRNSTPPASVCLNFKFLVFLLLFPILGSGLLRAQTAGTIGSNTDQLCVGSSEKIWTNGWGGGVWSSSNTNVVKITVNGSEVYATGVSSGNAEVTYTLNYNSQTYTTKKIFYVSRAVGSISPISGSLMQCAPVNGQVYSVEPVLNATKYDWKIPAGWTITGGANTNSITVSVGSGSGNIEVFASGNCSKTETKYLWVNVNGKVTNNPVAKSVSNIQCSSAQLNWDPVSNAVGYYIDIARDSMFTRYVPGYNSQYISYANYYADNLPTGNLYFRLKAVDVCGNITGYSNTVKFQTNAPYTGTVSPDQSVCPGSLPTKFSVKDYETSNAKIKMWQRSSTSDFTQNVVDINETGNELSGDKIGPVYSDTFVRVVIANNGNPRCTAYSDVIKISVDPLSEPSVAVSAATCAAGGSAAITNFNNNLVYIFSPAGPKVNATGLITDFAYGITYKVRAKNLTGCISSESLPFTVQAQLVKPQSPLVSTAPATCAAAGTAKITNYIATSTYSFFPAGPSVGKGGVISGLVAGTQYTVSTSYPECVSPPSAPFSVGAQMPAPSASAAVNGQAQVCQNTDILFNLTGSPNATVNYNLNGGEMGSVTLSDSGTATVKIPKATTDQTLNIVSVSNGICTSFTPSSAKVTVGAVSIYSGGSWSNGVPHNNGLTAIIKNDYNTVEGKVYACSILVTNNSEFTVGALNPLFLDNDIKVDAGSKLTVQNDANLIQLNDAAPANIGNITVLRDIKLSKGRAEYNYLGTPVSFAAGETFKTIYPGIAYALYYNESNNYFYSSSGVNIPGRGLAVKEPTVAAVPASNDKVTAKFVGVPQNGIISFPLANSNTGSSTSLGTNLVGNPYPSNIDLVKLYALNSGKAGGASVSPISATFYLWDSTVNTDYTQQGSSYSGQAYAVFNAAAGSKGTGTSAAGYLTGNISGKKTPTQVVKVGQGFLVKSLTKNGVLQFSNAVRTDSSAPIEFMGKTTGEKEDDRYWLTMTAPSQLKTSMAVVYFDGGSQGFGVEDSESRGGSDELFSMVDGTKTAINGRNIFSNDDTVALGARHFVNGQYTISLEKAEGIFADGQAVYLKDKNTGIWTDLTQGSYSFISEAGETTGRFEIKYQTEAVLSSEGAVKEELTVYRENSDFVVKSASKKITALELYDMNGRLLSKTAPNAQVAKIEASLLNNGVYIAVIHQNGVRISKKILK